MPALIQMERTEERKRGSETIAVFIKGLKDTVLSCIVPVQTWNLAPPPSESSHCLRTFAFEGREWGATRGGGRQHANIAIVYLRAEPTPSTTELKRGECVT